MTDYVVDYRVFTSGAFGHWSSLISGNILRFNHYTENGVKYQYRVYAWNGQGFGPTSPAVEQAAGKAVGPKLKAALVKVKLVWSPVKSAAPVKRYTLQYSLDGERRRALKVVKRAALKAGLLTFITGVGKKGKRVYFRASTTNMYGTGDYGTITKLAKR